MLFLWLCFLLSRIYGAIVILRNLLYSKKIKKSLCYTQPRLIGIGNLSLGGSGKTPMVIYLAKLLSKAHVVAVLSRGYKRKSSGFQVINNQTSVATAGDEPYLLHRLFSANPNVIIAVCANRAAGIAHIQTLRPDTQIILLDDAFQHRRITANLNIVVTPFDQPFFTDYLLPMGRLREPRQEIARADIIIVTKSPSNLTKEQINKIKTTIKATHPNLHNIPIFFTSLIHHHPIATWTNQKQQLPPSLLLVTGIADPLPLYTYLEKKGHSITHLAFRDHHWFQYRDIMKIIDTFQKIPHRYKAIITTEKDYVRLIDPSWEKLLTALPLFYIAIDIGFIPEQEELLFHTTISHYVDHGGN